MSENTLAIECTATALKQLMTSWSFKQPRLTQIRKFRSLYNNQIERALRIRYNVPIPIFAGMIDTLQADLDDAIILKYHEADPADWKAAMKANAYLQKEMTSMRPGAKWNQKFRLLRQEVLMTGRGFLKYNCSKDGGYSADLTSIAFEDFYFEPKGGGNLEDHLFSGVDIGYKTKTELEKGVEDGIYDAAQVKLLVGNSDGSGSDYKKSSFWEQYDFANRFQSLNLSSEAHNYVGEPVFNMFEWVLNFKGRRWYILFEAFSGIWIRFCKLSEINSSDYLPWMSLASHQDAKNFASKGFADDLYPIAKTMGEFFNEDLENRKRRNSNARAYDKDMFPNVAQLDQAQMGRDRLVEVDTKNGTRKISDGIYAFTTPEITGTIDVLKYMEDMAGRNLGVNDLQKGDQGGQKTVGVTYAEMSQVSKRLSFQSQPFIEIGQELGMRVFGGLKDYLSEPLSIKILGENGYEWDTIKRIDLNIKKDFEVSVASESQENKLNELSKANKAAALERVANRQMLNPTVNYRMIDELDLREAGFDESEIALILDPQSHADKRTRAETSAAIQDIMMGRVPKKNYNASAYFLQSILDFVKTNQGDKKIAKKLPIFLKYIQDHAPIAADNEKRRAQNDASTMKAQARKQMNPTDGQGTAPAQTVGPSTALPQNTAAAKTAAV